MEKKKKRFHKFSEAPSEVPSERGSVFWLEEKDLTWREAE